jgi:Rrf2 family protein
LETLLRISEAATLGMHAMLCLAVNGGERPLSVKHLSGVLGVSEAHLGKVLQRLVRQGLLKSRRGPRGGFALRRLPEDIRLIDIYNAVSGPLPEGTCLLVAPVCAPNTCILGDVLEQVQKLVHTHFTNTTLAAMAARSSLASNLDLH